MTASALAPASTASWPSQLAVAGIGLPGIDNVQCIAALQHHNYCNAAIARRFTQSSLLCLFDAKDASDVAAIWGRSGMVGDQGRTVA